MTGLLTILEGPGKGTSKPLGSALVIVGRSKNADFQIDDPMASRRHLEIRSETDGVFIENKSTQGSVLNGKPLVGIVSLNTGDIIEVGGTKIRFDEVAVAPASGKGSSAEMESELDGTRIAGPELEMHRQKSKDDEAPDETRAVVEDGTRMLAASELPNWAAQIEKGKPVEPTKTPMLLVVIVAVIVAAAALWYFTRSKHQSSAGDTIEYKDSLYSFDLSYPLDWSKVTDDAGLIAFGYGKETDPDYVRLKIYTDKSVDHELTGLTDGFLQYQKDLKQQYQGFELTAKKVARVHNTTMIIFWFDSPTVEGKGVYTLNGDGRVVVECVSPRPTYPQHDADYSKILQNFRLGEFIQQQYIEYPMPDEGMQQLALASPTGLAHQIDEFIKTGDTLLASKNVRPDNLFGSVQAYRQAMQLAIAAPERLAISQSIARKLADASSQFNDQLQHQRFEISHALNEGDRVAAYWQANKMMQMVPDKTDPSYQEAYGILRTLPVPTE